MGKKRQSPQGRHYAYNQETGALEEVGGVPTNRTVINSAPIKQNVAPVWALDVGINDEPYARQLISKSEFGRAQDTNLTKYLDELSGARIDLTHPVQREIAGMISSARKSGPDWKNKEFYVGELNIPGFGNKATAGELTGALVNSTLTAQLDVVTRLLGPKASMGRVSALISNATEAVLQSVGDFYFETSANFNQFVTQGMVKGARTAWHEDMGRRKMTDAMGHSTYLDDRIEQTLSSDPMRVNNFSDTLDEYKTDYTTTGTEPGYLSPRQKMQQRKFSSDIGNEFPEFEGQASSWFENEALAKNSPLRLSRMEKAAQMRQNIVEGFVKYVKESGTEIPSFSAGPVPGYNPENVDRLLSGVDVLSNSSLRTMREITQASKLYGGKNPEELRQIVTGNLAGLESNLQYLGRGGSITAQGNEDFVDMIYGSTGQADITASGLSTINMPSEQVRMKLAQMSSNELYGFYQAKRNSWALKNKDLKEFDDWFGGKWPDQMERIKSAELTASAAVAQNRAFAPIAARQDEVAQFVDDIAKDFPEYADQAASYANRAMWERDNPEIVKATGKIISGNRVPQGKPGLAGYVDPEPAIPEPDFADIADPSARITREILPSKAMRIVPSSNQYLSPGEFGRFDEWVGSNYMQGGSKLGGLGSLSYPVAFAGEPDFPGNRTSERFTASVINRTGRGVLSGMGTGGIPPINPPPTTFQDPAEPPSSGGGAGGAGSPSSNDDFLNRNAAMWEAHAAGHPLRDDPNYGVVSDYWKGALNRLYKSAGSIGVSGLYTQSELYGKLEKSGPNSARYIGEGDTVTISGSQVSEGVDLARSAAKNALDQGGLENLRGGDLGATIKQRVYDYINKHLDTALSSDSPGTMEHAQKLKMVANSAVSSLINQAAYEAGSTSGGVSSVGGGARLKRTSQFLSMAEENPEFASIMDEAGGPEAMMRGPKMVRSFNTASGAMSVSYGGGWGGGGRGGGRGGGWGGGGGGEGFDWDENNNLKNPRSTDIGKFMMAAWMGSMLWQNTGGRVVTAATEYATNQYDIGALSQYGSGERSGAETYASEVDLAKDRYGRISYEQVGGLVSAGTDIMGMASDNTIKNVNKGLTIAGGAGIAAIVASVVGVAALPVAATVAAAGATAWAGSAISNAELGAYNRAAGLSDSQGLNTKGIFSNMALSLTGMPGATGSGAMFGWHPTVAGQEARAAELGTTRRDQISGLFGGGVADYLTGGPPSISWAGGQTTEMDELATQVAEERSITKPDATKALGEWLPTLGGLEGAKGDLAKKLIKTSGDLGMSDAALGQQLGQAAEAQGLSVGSPQYLALANEFAGFTTPGQLAKKVGGITGAYQMYSQLAYYMPGESMRERNAAAKQVYDSAGLQGATQVSVAQSAIAQAQQFTPTSVVQNTALALSTQSLGPIASRQAMSVASQAAQYGAQDFTTTMANFAGGQGIMSAQQASDLASGNPYENADWGRKAGIGWMQTVDAQGRPAGEVDSSGILQFARQTMFPGSNGGRGMSDTQVLDAMGYYKGDAEMQGLYISGGDRATTAEHSTRMFDYQMQGFGIQQAQIAGNRSYLMGSGNAANPSAGSAWGIQNQQMGIQWAGQQAQWRYQATSMDTQHQFAETNQQANEQRFNVNFAYQNQQRGFQYQTGLMQRGWQRENFQYQQGMSSLQHGWEEEDMDLNIRRSSGADRAQLIKQRDRSNVAFNAETSQADKERKRQEELWKREDQRYTTEVAHEQQLGKMTEMDFQREKQQRDVLYKLDKENFERQVEDAKKLHALQIQATELQRKHEERSLALQAAAVAVQQKAAEEQQKWEEANRGATNFYKDQAAYFRMMYSWSPKITQAMNSILQLGRLNFVVEVRPRGIYINGKLSVPIQVTQPGAGGG